jgi:subtilisin family serine protease
MRADRRSQARSPWRRSHGAIAAALSVLGLLPGCVWRPLEVPAADTYRIQAEFVVVATAAGAGDGWNLLQIGVGGPVEAPDAGQVAAAVVDTGVDPRHPDLAGRLLPMQDMVGDDTYDARVAYKGRDGNGHGTHIAGIMASVLGTARVPILPVKAIGHSGVGDDRTIARGVRAAVDYRDPGRPDLRVRVINLSVGGKTSSAVLEEAIRYALSKDVLVVVAAGNRERGVDFPAAEAVSLAVGATTIKDQLASYSNRGPELAISAPGGDGSESVMSTWPTYLTASDHKKGVSAPHAYGGMVGTSMAAPHVTATAALLFAMDSRLTAEQVRTRLQATADDLGPVGPDPYFGLGRVNVKQALKQGGHDAR